MRGLRPGAAAVAAAVLAAVLAGCGDGDSGPVATEVVVVTASDGSSPASAPATSSAGSSGTAALQAGYDRLAASLPADTGLAVVPVGGGEPLLFGDQDPTVAWSTIKVPLALAAERKNGASAAETAAITASDNAAAETLWSSLGTAEQAARAVTAVLREGGDKTSTVPSVQRRAGYTIFGQTSWALTDAATFTANLPCLPGSAHLVELMGQVQGNQQWGVEVIPGRATAVKGGWGPAVDGGYTVRQIGLVTRKDGKRIAVAMSTYAPGASMDSGIAVLNRLADWIGTHLARLPAGRCP